MKTKIGLWLLLIAVGVIGGYLIGKGDTKVIKVPIKIEVPVPVVVSDTVWKDSLIPRPYPIENPVNEDMLAEYDRLKDTLDKRNAYIKSITKRKYVEVFDDSIQTVTVFANTTGVLDSLGMGYVTKPRTVELDTLVEVEVPIRRNLSLYVEGGSKFSDELKPLLKVGGDITNKKNIIYGASYDSEKRIWLKIGKKFNW